MIEDCIKHLGRMLSVRKPEQAFINKNKDTDDAAFLLSKGIFSDSHMLALMYGGEACYWGCTPPLAKLQHKQEDLHEKACTFLGTYVEVVDRLPGWNSARAKEMLAELAKLKQHEEKG